MSTCVFYRTVLTSAILLSSLFHGVSGWAASCPGVNFVGASTLSAGPNPLSVTASDFNNNGKADLVVANGGTTAVWVLLGNGDSSFQNAVTYGTGANPASVAVGDFNADGKRDLAVAIAA